MGPGFVGEHGSGGAVGSVVAVQSIKYDCFFMRIISTCFVRPLTHIPYCSEQQFLVTAEFRSSFGVFIVVGLPSFWIFISFLHFWKNEAFLSKYSFFSSGCKFCNSNIKFPASKY